MSFNVSFTAAFTAPAKTHARRKMLMVLLNVYLYSNGPSTDQRFIIEERRMIPCKHRRF
jgi:hypothetical protein